jgi:hypothetical protein
MKKISIVATKQSRNISQQKLTLTGEQKTLFKEANEEST